MADYRCRCDGCNDPRRVMGIHGYAATDNWPEKIAGLVMFLSAYTITLQVDRSSGHHNHAVVVGR